MFCLGDAGSRDKIESFVQSLGDAWKLKGGFYVLTNLLRSGEWRDVYVRSHSGKGRGAWCLVGCSRCGEVCYAYRAEPDGEALLRRLLRF